MATNNVWELVPRPQNKNIVSCRWVFKVKRLLDGQIDRYKARLVARGFSQQKGIDYDETFAPVMRMETLRLLLAIGAAEDLEMHQMDVVTAYLAGDLQEEIYMEMPEGLPGNLQNHVCTLKKGLYGLKQSARVWNQRIAKTFKQLQFVAAVQDQSVWVHTTTNVIIALYVDDMIILGRKMSAVQEIKDSLSREYNMKDLGEVRNVLGLRVQRDRSKRTLWIDQTHYIEETLRAFQLENCKGVSTPADGYDNLQAATTDEALFDDAHLYRRALGQLNWL